MSKDFYGDLISRLEKFARLSKVFTIGFGGIFLTFSQFIEKSHEFIGFNVSNTFFSVGFTLTAFSWVIVLITEVGSAELIRRINELKIQKNLVEAEKNDREGWMIYNSKYLGIIAPIKEFVDQAISGNILQKDKKLVFETILEYIIERKYTLFGVSDEYWNLAIYEYDDSSQLLKCTACLRARQSEGGKVHRDWRPGEGHVGKAFELKSELICSDATQPDIARWVTATGKNYLSSDESRYVSLAAYPIALHESDPLGVLIFTSDQPGRFRNLEDPDESASATRLSNAEPLNTVAGMIAQIIFLMQNQNPQQKGSCHVPENPEPPSESQAFENRPPESKD